MQNFGGYHAVTLFSLTNEIMLANKTPNQILDEFLATGVTKNIEIDGPQHFRNYPAVAYSEIDELRQILKKHDAQVVQLGIYIDRATAPGVMLTDDQVMAHLRQQIELTSKLGARFARLALGAATEAELMAMLPILMEFDVALLLEVQGTVEPDSPLVLGHLDLFESLNDPHLGFVFDLSLCMTLLPPSYISALTSAGFSDETIATIRLIWSSGSVDDIKKFVFTQLMPSCKNDFAVSLALTLATRMGRTEPNDWQRAMKFVQTVHLKFWDTDNADRAVSQPIAALIESLAAQGFTGPLISEWGGHEWVGLEEASSLVLARHKVLYEEAMTLAVD